MIATRRPAAGSVRFRCRKVTADAVAVARVREQFAQWLRRCTDLGETRLCDVVLAVNEALANAAEFAYLEDRRPGRLDLEALVRDGALTVDVADHGCWRSTDSTQQQRCRGRGIPLMCTLSDSVAIDATSSGTSVRLRFDQVHPARPADVLA
jgi:anti-sigma regulatory factor (Ser/Thr protein kinase)